MKIADSYHKRCAKQNFLKHGWWWRKIAFAFYPIAIPAAYAVVFVIVFVDSVIAACKEFYINFGYCWRDAMRGTRLFGMFDAVYVGWFVWSKQKAVDYLFGLTDEELKGEDWPGLPPTHSDEDL